MGELSSAEVAAPPSPPKPATPVPATVVMIPSGPIRRTRWAPKSATKRLPSESTRTSIGRSSWAAAAWPPSPADPATPVPA